MELTTKNFFERDSVQNKFKELLGNNSKAFITSVLQCVNSNELLKKATPESVFNAAATAAILNLPLNNSLGFSYIVPFKTKGADGNYKDVAQFQIGYKGFVQLAQRSGQFKTISAAPIYEGQLVEENPLTGFEFNFAIKNSQKVIGYAAFFELLNGFRKTLYMDVEQLKAHGLKFSQTFKKGFGLWATDFDAMAQKTVIKMLLSKFAPLSIEMQQAVIYDQAVITEEQAVYVDNEIEVITPTSYAEIKGKEREAANDK